MGIYRQLVAYMKEHFRDDARGKRAAFYFLPWHFNFFARYRWACSCSCCVPQLLSAKPPVWLSGQRKQLGPCRPLPRLPSCSPMPEAVYGAASLQQPLLSTRWDSIACGELGETVEGLAPLERLLRCENEAAFGPIADALWEAACDADAEAALVRLAAGNLLEWEEELRAGGSRGGRREEAQAQG